MLKSDLGPFENKEEEWGSMSVVIKDYQARITAVSADQSLRGIRHHEHRPDLVICDDVEDLASVKTRESRDKTYNWFTGEIMPLGGQSTKLIVVGNLLHEDSLLMRLKRDIDGNRRDGIFRHYPLINDKGMVLWPGMYPDPETVEKKHRAIGNEVAWQREYLLRIVPDHDQIIHPEWIRYYDMLPSVKEKGFRGIVVGVDPAISKSHTADYTATVSALVYGYGENLRVYIMPNLVNERLTHLETLKQIEMLYSQLHSKGRINFVVEDVAYQHSLVEQLCIRHIPNIPFKPGTSDKFAKLNTVSHLFQSGQVLFPRHGAKILIDQLTNFGVERFDDLADALVLILHEVNKKEPVTPEIFYL